MEEHEAMVLLSLKHRLQDWFRQGEALVEVIDSLLPTNRTPRLTIEEIIRETGEICGIGKS